MTTAPLRLLALAAFALAGSAPAQNFDAMIQQQMRAMNQNIERGNQQINQMVQQKMQDPQVRASYEQYVYQQRMRGQAAMDYPTYTYNYIYTRGFSADGTAHARANEANISANAPGQHVFRRRGRQLLRARHRRLPVSAAAALARRRPHRFAIRDAPPP